MQRPSDEELRALLDPAYQHHSPETVRLLVEELLERRAAGRNADGVAAELRRWNGEE